MSFRSAIPDFQLANPLYVGAVVSFFTVNVSGVKTSTLAPLYASPIGAIQLPNPQVLDAEGKFTTPVYHDVSVIAEVVSDSADTVDTGIILPVGQWAGNWTTATIYDGNAFIRDPINLSIYVATNTYLSSGSIATDVSNGDLVLVFQGESTAVATAAAIAAQAAAATATAAANAAAATLANAATLQGNSINVPSGPTGSRPGTVVAADRVIRWSTAFAWLETWNGGTWGPALRSINEIGDVDTASTPPAVGDGFVWDGAAWVPGPAGGGMFKGDNGTVGSRSGDIFRISDQQLDLSVTIGATENASAPGPLAVATGVTLTVSSGGNLVIL